MITRLLDTYVVSFSFLCVCFFCNYFCVSFLFYIKNTTTFLFQSTNEVTSQFQHDANGSCLLNMHDIVLYCIVVHRGLTSNTVLTHSTGNKPRDLSYGKLKMAAVVGSKLLS